VARRFRASAACLASTLFAAACAPRVPGIADPIRVDAHCSPREARITGIRSVLASTSDVVLAESPSEAGVVAETRSGDGAVAYWNEQPLLLAKTAAMLGEVDGFARVRAVAIPPPPQGAATSGGPPSRTIYLDVRDHGRYRWIAMHAFDTQNICIEGHKQA